MDGEHIITDLKDLCESDSITKNELLDLLKRYVQTISVYDQMMTTARLRKDGEFITTNYRDKYLKIYIENFIMRIKEVLMKSITYDDEIDVKSIKESFHSSRDALKRKVRRISMLKKINFHLCK